MVTVFDRTIGAQLASVVPNCTVTSPADVAAPSVVAACIPPTALAVLAGGTAARAFVDHDGAAVALPWTPDLPGLTERLARWVPHRHGGAEGLFVAGLLGLAAIIAMEWVARRAGA